MGSTLASPSISLRSPLPLPCAREAHKFRIKLLGWQTGAGRDQPYLTHPAPIPTANATPAPPAPARGGNRPVAQAPLGVSALAASQAVRFNPRAFAAPFSLKSASHRPKHFPAAWGQTGVLKGVIRTSRGVGMGSSRQTIPVRNSFGQGKTFSCRRLLAFELGHREIAQCHQGNKWLGGRLGPLPTPESLPNTLAAKADLQLVL